MAWLPATGFDLRYAASISGINIVKEAMKSAYISLVLPCFNESAVIQNTYDRLEHVLASLDVTYEIIFVDDGSKDNTFDLLSLIAQGDKRCKVISFTRNFGQQNAISAGLRSCSGDAVIVMDADLQDPPELIADMVQAWRQGHVIVCGRRTRRMGDSMFKKVTAHLFYRLVHLLTDISMPYDTGDFRLMDRKIIDYLNKMDEPQRFVRGMISWLGFDQFMIPYTRTGRHAGRTKYTPYKMIKLALTAITSFSTKPLIFAASMGLGTAVLILMFLSFLFIQCLNTSSGLSQRAMLTVAAAIVMLIGILFINLGVLGIYMGAIFNTIKKRPLYIINQTCNFEEPLEKADSL